MLEFEESKQTNKQIWTMTLGYDPLNQPVLSVWHLQGFTHLFAIAFPAAPVNLYQLFSSKRLWSHLKGFALLVTWNCERLASSSSL